MTPPGESWDRRTMSETAGLGIQDSRNFAQRRTYKVYIKEGKEEEKEEGRKGKLDKGW